MSATFFCNPFCIQRFLFLGKVLLVRKMCTFTPRIAPLRRLFAACYDIRHSIQVSKPSKRPKVFLNCQVVCKHLRLGAIRQSNHSILEHLRIQPILQHTLAETTEFDTVKHTSKNFSSIFCRFFLQDWMSFAP